jgi:hypothetical protein
MPSRGGARTTGVWAATDMETFSVWSDEVRNAKAAPHLLELNCYYRKANFSDVTGFLFPAARSSQQQFGYS